MQRIFTVSAKETAGTGYEKGAEADDRRNNQVLEMSKEELENFIHEQIKAYPYRPLALSKYLSKRPSFYGAI